MVFTVGSVIYETYQHHQIMMKMKKIYKYLIAIALLAAGTLGFYVGLIPGLGTIVVGLWLLFDTIKEKNEM